MLGGNNTCSEKLFDGLFVAVSHCDLYDIIAIFLGCLLSVWLKQLFHLLTMFFGQELGKALPGQGISAPRGCLHWGCRVRSGMTCPHDWQVGAGCGPWLLSVLASLWAAQASSQHGGWAPRASVPRGQYGSHKAPADLGREVTWHHLPCIRSVTHATKVQPRLKTREIRPHR